MLLQPLQGVWLHAVLLQVVYSKLQHGTAIGVGAWQWVWSTYWQLWRVYPVSVGPVSGVVVSKDMCHASIIEGSLLHLTVIDYRECLLSVMGAQ